MNQQHMCEHEHCISIETQECHNPDDTTVHLCANHAVANGYCLWCLEFGAGSEDYDFSTELGGARGYHRSCWTEIQNIEDFEDEAEYPDTWYDPDMDFENEPSNGRDIGEGSEYAS